MHRVRLQPLRYTRRWTPTCGYLSFHSSSGKGRGKRPEVSCRIAKFSAAALRAAWRRPQSDEPHSVTSHVQTRGSFGCTKDTRKSRRVCGGGSSHSVPYHSSHRRTSTSTCCSTWSRTAVLPSKKASGASSECTITWLAKENPSTPRSWYLSS